MLLLVRVLLMFRLDNRVRAAVSQLLLAISLDSALICRRRHGSQTWNIILPEVMTSSLRLPFITTPHRHPPLCHNSEELPVSSLTEPITISGERVSISGLLHSAWSLAWHGELDDPPAAPEYSRELVMPQWQVALAAAGVVEKRAAETLRQLEGVSSHTAARVLLSQLRCLMMLHRWMESDDRLVIFIFIFLLRFERHHSVVNSIQSLLFINRFPIS